MINTIIKETDHYVLGVGIPEGAEGKDKVLSYIVVHKEYNVEELVLSQFHMADYAIDKMEEQGYGQEKNSEIKAFEEANISKLN